MPRWILSLCSQFRWARRRLGGRWFKIYDSTSGGDFWTQIPADPAAPWEREIEWENWAAGEAG